MHPRQTNSNLENITSLIKPQDLFSQIPANEKQLNFVYQQRQLIGNLIKGKSNKLLAIIGPCSIHDEKAALEFAHLLKSLASDVSDKIYIIMRLYFEKPRTSLGWKGLINDPDLDGSYDIKKGLLLARKILLAITDLKLACATEFIDTITPHYISDLISWAAIGARTVESQIHRSMASGLPMPVGFKNNVSGNISSAINAVKSANQPHRFLSIDNNGMAAIIKTKGNKDCHIILRGGEQGVNYTKGAVDSVMLKCKELIHKPRVLIDTSHGNSPKGHDDQLRVISEVAQQIVAGNQQILGLMVESNLVAGKQELNSPKDLTYGLSITDPCLDFVRTKEAIMSLYRIL